MSPTQPYPIEIALVSGLVLRGLEHDQDGPPVVLVHDVGGDADSWRGLPADLTAKGFRVVNLELRGHGLSDGDIDPDTTVDDLREALTIIGGSFGPVGFIGIGEVATAALCLGPGEGSPVHILLSPTPSDACHFERAVPAMRAIFAGTADQKADGLIRSVYQRLPGQNMWFSTGTDAHGIDLLGANPTVIEQMAMFLRRYLTGHHLAWIAGHRPGSDSDGFGTEEGQSRPAADQ